MADHGSTDRADGLEYAHAHAIGTTKPGGQVEHAWLAGLLERHMLPGTGIGDR